MAEGQGFFRCYECGCQTWESLAHLGSFYYRCEGCGGDVVATSLRPVLCGLSDDEVIDVRLDQRTDRSVSSVLAAEILHLSTEEVMARDPLLQGPLRDMRVLIFALAERGIHLVLIIQGGLAAAQQRAAADRMRTAAERENVGRRS